MSFGRTSLPSRMFAYGAREPIAGLQSINEQFFLANKFRNDLVTIERSRREEREKIIKEFCPKLSEADSKLEAIEEEIEAQYTLIREKNKQAKRKIGDKEASAACKQLKKERASLRKQRSELAKKTYSDPGVKASLDEVDDTHNERAKAAYNAEENLFWGTKLVERAAVSRSGHPPKWHRFDGTGLLAVQLQQQKNKPKFTPAVAFSGASGYLRIDPLPESAWKKSPSHRKTLVHIKVGVDEKNKPVWATVPIKMHRPLPSDAAIKFVYLTRRRIGTHFKWEVVFCLSKDQWEEKNTAHEGLIAFDLGWRMKSDGSLRVAYWAASDGTDGELVIPAGRVSTWKHVESMQSLCDRLFDEQKALLKAWLKDHKDVLPAWIQEQTTTFDKWRSARRLAMLAIKWRENRFEGDEEVFDKLEQWRKTDRHLSDWREFERKKIIRWREWYYRNILSELSKKYRFAVFEDVAWSTLQQNKTPDDMAPNVSKTNKGIAAVGRLQLLANQYFTHGKVNARKSTTTCNHCNNECKFEKKAASFTCERCGTFWDRDRCAALNLKERGLALYPEAVAARVTQTLAPNLFEALSQRSRVDSPFPDYTPLAEVEEDCCSIRG